MDEIATIGCDCCGYTAEIAISSSQVGILMGTIQCRRCAKHVVFLMKFVHRFQDWRWVRTYLPKD